jgi:phage antirepressor YoqD-like protein
MIAEAAAKESKEKAEGYELLIEKADNYSLKEAADLLGSGQNRFSKWLKTKSYLQLDGIPYQTYLRNQPYFVLKEVTKAGIVYHTPMITPKGMDYFTKLRNKGQMDQILNKVVKTLDTSIIK